MLTKGSLKTANKKFSSLNNDYEMSLQSDSQILAVHEDDGGVPQIKFNFVQLSEIENIEPNTLVGMLSANLN